MCVTADINECLVNNGGCDVHSICHNTIGSRTCSERPLALLVSALRVRMLSRLTRDFAGACIAGFTGFGNATCKDINEVRSRHELACLLASYYLFRCTPVLACRCV
jgi:hypothetical protein